MNEHECLIRAQLCERRASLDRKSDVKNEWSELAIEWHYLAHCVTQQTGPEIMINDEDEAGR